MNNGIIISFLILFVFILLAITTSLLTSIIFSPSIHTPREILSEIIKLLSPKDGEIIYDLGSGDGRVLIACRKKAKIKGFGYDISPIIVLYSKINKLVNLGFISDIFLDSNNIFDLKLKDVDKIYVYQTGKILKILDKKFEKELKDVTVFTYRNALEKRKEFKKYKLSNGEYLFEYRY